MQSCQSGPVTAADILVDQAAILRTQDATAAGLEAAAIAAGTDTELAYIARLIQQVQPTTIPAVLVYNQMYNFVPSSAELDKLVPFDQNQFNFGTKVGVQDPIVYVYEALGQALAAGNELGQTTFANNFGPGAIANDTNFVVAAYQQVFGVLPSLVQQQHFVDQVAFFNKIYTANPPQGATTPAAIDLLARGAVFGQMLGVAAENNTPQSYLANAAAFLEDVATVNNFTGLPVGKYSVALNTEPQNHNPFVPGVSINLTSAADIVSPNNTDPQFRSTNGDDLLVSSAQNQLNDLDVLNGALGFDTLQGRFSNNAAPTLTNIEKVELQAQAPNETFNFANSTGIQEAFVKGDPDGFQNTTFKGLNLNWHVGVENFDNSTTGGTHTSTFNFTGANGTQTVELDLNKAGLFDATIENTNGNETNIVIDKIAGLNICVTGASNVILDSADSLTNINVFGNAGLRLDLDDSDTPVLNSVDAHGLNGFLVLDIGDESDFGGALTIQVGTKGSVIEIDGEVADKITNGAGPDLAIFNEARNVDAGVNISVTGVLDAQAIQILAFNPSQDSIDLSNTNAAPDGIYILTGAQNAGTEAQATLRAAAELALEDAANAAGNPDIAVFTYTVSGVDSTYVVVDNVQPNNNTLQSGDGLIKLVGVLGVTAADFIV